MNLKMCKEMLRAAAVLDASNLHIEADEIERVMMRLADDTMVTQDATPATSPAPTPMPWIGQIKPGGQQYDVSQYCQAMINNITRVFAILNNPNSAIAAFPVLIQQLTSLYTSVNQSAQQAMKSISSKNNTSAAPQTGQPNRQGAQVGKFVLSQNYSSNALSAIMTTLNAMANSIAKQSTAVFRGSFQNPAFPALYQQIQSALIEAEKLQNQVKTFADVNNSNQLSQYMDQSGAKNNSPQLSSGVVDQLGQKAKQNYQNTDRAQMTQGMTPEQQSATMAKALTSYKKYYSQIMSVPQNKGKEALAKKYVIEWAQSHNQSAQFIQALTAALA